MAVHLSRRARTADNDADAGRARPVVLACTVALAAAFVAIPAQAATTFTQVSLTATVTGSSVTASASIKASTTTVVAQYGICARDAAGKNIDFPAKKTNVTISSSGTAYSATRTFSPGIVTYYPCVLSDGKWSSVGKKTFTVALAPPAGPTVLFEDDFSGEAGQSFDGSKWKDWSSCAYHASAAFGNIKCGDSETLDGKGHLSIPADPNSGSALSTATKFGFTYGEASAWIKVPAADGYWPAFWTLNAEPGCCATKTLPVGELDIMEQYTTWDSNYNRAFHAWNGDLTWHGGIATCGNVDLTAAFHKYTVRVEPSRITYFFDGVQCGRAITPDIGGGKAYPFGPDLTDPNFLILDLAVGGAGGQQNPATTPATLLVDRVEVKSL